MFSTKYNPNKDAPFNYQRDNLVRSLVQSILHYYPLASIDIPLLLDKMKNDPLFNVHNDQAKEDYRSNDDKVNLANLDFIRNMIKAGYTNFDGGNIEHQIRFL